MSIMLIVLLSAAFLGNFAASIYESHPALLDTAALAVTVAESALAAALIAAVISTILMFREREG